MKQLQINCPDGYEIDQDKSDLSKGIVYFKEVKKDLTYTDIRKKLFSGDTICWITGNLITPTKEQQQSILALNKLCNVAKYLNGDWLPKFTDLNQPKHVIYRNNITNKLHIMQIRNIQAGEVCFKSKELALQAIKILGEKEICKALTLNH